MSPSYEIINYDQTYRKNGYIAKHIWYQALFPDELLSFDSRLEGDLFFDIMSPISGEDVSCLNGTNIGFDGALMAFPGDPCCGRGERIGGDNEVDAGADGASGLALELR